MSQIVLHVEKGIQHKFLDYKMANRAIDRHSTLGRRVLGGLYSAMGLSWVIGTYGAVQRDSVE
ncbi:hypothetical protein GALMADRAFT_1183160 [Galerina marginata CBS 339.88]|uniref:Uncharacterized protein n=1 Tax=Galerina marginata (strain CBS 339.88) TaxID=685588 RepID=A0A067TAC9_GALM3|nr:hypothetical protein GALMADRAFT_1183160 [Galerina marginata CBS 339.88]